MLFWLTLYQQKVSSKGTVCTSQDWAWCEWKTTAELSARSSVGFVNQTQKTEFGYQWSCHSCRHKQLVYPHMVYHMKQWLLWSSSVQCIVAAQCCCGWALALDSIWASSEWCCAAHKLTKSHFRFHTHTEEICLTMAYVSYSQAWVVWTSLLSITRQNHCRISVTCLYWSWHLNSFHSSVRYCVVIMSIIEKTDFSSIG